MGKELPQKVFLRVNGTDYDLKSGIIENYGEFEEGIFNFDISLFTEPIGNVNSDNPFGDASVSGVYFELFTTNESNIATGTYDFSSNFGSENTFTFAAVLENCLFSTDGDDVNCENEFAITGGTFTVNAVGNQFDLEFSASLMGGGSAEGKYVGSLIALDESDFLMEGSAYQAKRKRLVLE